MSNPTQHCAPDSPTAVPRIGGPAYRRYYATDRRRTDTNTSIPFRLLHTERVARMHKPIAYHLRASEPAQEYQRQTTLPSHTVTPSACVLRFLQSLKSVVRHTQRRNTIRKYFTNRIFSCRFRRRHQRLALHRRRRISFKVARQNLFLK